MSYKVKTKNNSYYVDTDKKEIMGGVFGTIATEYISIVVKIGKPMLVLLSDTERVVTTKVQGIEKI